MQPLKETDTAAGFSVLNFRFLFSSYTFCFSLISYIFLIDRNLLFLNKGVAGNLITLANSLVFFFYVGIC